ncbi:hypothetical protein AB1Y20_010866 [Prymnesium parvum]|uniref:Amino acid transporter transmembrane domain-containing protein n=1 Tax=Prymnesium parvum TaxID=97485 RepID=A0AB34ISP8_PRYPA
MDVRPARFEWHAFANLLKTMVGSGVLTLPFVTARVGLLFSLLGLGAIAYLTQCGIRMVVTCAAAALKAGAYRQLPPTDPADQGGGLWSLVGGAAFGAPGRVLTLGALLTAQLGVCASYLDFVAAALHTHAAVPPHAALAGVWLLLSLLCLVRPLKAVSWLSTAALLIYVYILGLLVYFGAGAPARAAPLEWWRPRGVGAWFGPALFAFEGMGTALSIFTSMESDDPAPFYRVVSVAYACAFVVYSFAAVVGYAAWGGSVAQVVLDSFPESSLALSADLSLACILLLSFCLQMTPVFQLAELSLSEPCRRLWPLVRCVIVGMIAIIAAAIPDMEQMVALTGSLSFSIIGFVLPGAFFLKLSRRSLAFEHDVVVACALIVLGLGGGAFGLYTTFEGE